MAFRANPQASWERIHRGPLRCWAGKGKRASLQSCFGRKPCGGEVQWFNLSYIGSSDLGSLFSVYIEQEPSILHVRRQYTSSTYIQEHNANKYIQYYNYMYVQVLICQHSLMPHACCQELISAVLTTPGS